MKYEEIADAKDALTFALEALNDDNLDAVYLTAYGRYDVFDITIALLEDAVADADDDYELIKSIDPMGDRRFAEHISESYVEGRSEVYSFSFIYRPNREIIDTVLITTKRN